MKLLTMLFLFTSVSYAQMLSYEMTKREILSDIIRQEKFNKGDVFISTKIDSSNVEHLLKLVLEKPFVTNFNNPTENLILTKEDLEYLAKSIRKQYQQEWKEEEFNNRQLIQPSAIIECLKKNVNNQIFMVSDPISFKSDNTVFVYLANLCCITAYGNSSLALYTKKDGIWKKSFEIIRDDY